MAFSINPTRRSTVSFGKPLSGSQCFCVFCKRKKEFGIPSELADRFVSGKVVLFAGAGISTEAKGVAPNTFYQTIEYILGDGVSGRPFPDLMEAYCRTPAGRSGLITELMKHFEYIYSHKEIFDQATRFHRELSTFTAIDTIVTTNWDTYFEDECAATPFVDDRDTALWEAAPRKVLKLHGTISNFGSIVATRSDYKKCAKRLNQGALGKLLTSLLATRSTVFIGYSLRDEDFLQIYRAVRKDLESFHHQAYFVAPEISDEDQTRLRELGLHLIETDGQFFIAELKKHAQSNSCICDDAMYEGVADLLSEVHDAHDWLHSQYSLTKHPQVLFCAWYQDGMEQALSRILRLRKTGKSSDLHRLIGTAQSYEHFSRRLKQDRRYGDAAYCSGYSNGYYFAAQFTNRNVKKLTPPLYFYFGHQSWSRSEYRRRVGSFPTLHRAAAKFAQQLAAKLPEQSGFVLHHPPSLDLEKYLNEQEPQRKKHTKRHLAHA